MVRRFGRCSGCECDIESGPGARSQCRGKLARLEGIDEEPFATGRIRRGIGDRGGVGREKLDRDPSAAFMLRRPRKSVGPGANRGHAGDAVDEEALR